MNFQLWLLFLGTTIFISATPGPNMLLMLSHGARYGLQATLVTMAGAITGLSILIGLSALGVGAILAASVTLFTALKIAGALYLIYLGIQSWRAGENLRLPNADASDAQARFKTGLAVALSNPKAILFAGAFLPQFIDTSLPQGQQWAILLSSFFIIEISWQIAYAWGGNRLASWLQEPKRIRLFNRACGAAFFTVGGLLALARR
ncbi:LysE family translocator [Chitinibacter fontanus]|uniref:LysE family translocator n=1 Tax=Chitinibacter fontanus TaxID=1737446 RepID=A0A7D5V8S7_9NEIS|nr:LysE family translocator [Chitinibacter fontanus]QLI80931.1 LysE family translocator [Chitinibacter fontanus]